ncbi:helix-turn-helix domain-containing protein [Lentzea kentuckyensis]|uniref:helix-turn-helix domain-containing protein n=1 Tax=Lentzea kentuckyensis TaxID=360086 RepID=UPI000A3CF556|nr:helix-turn-helix transcriptional regulator [Lentzea kentuckyensis]
MTSDSDGRGDLEGLAARLADELAREMRAVQDRAKKSAAQMAAIVGRQQPWWSKLTSGYVRQPKVDVLRALLMALNTDEADIERIADIATRLNDCYVRHSRPLGRMTDDPEGIDRRVAELAGLIGDAVKRSTLTAAEVSRRVGRTEGYVTRVICGRFQRPDPVTLKAVAFVLGMSEAKAARVRVLVNELSRM